MVDHQDHYNVLGVHARASCDEVKKAYRALSKVFHPDKAGDVGENEKRDRERRMVALNVAYDIIGSPRQRKEYDLSKEVPSHQHPPRGPSFHQRPDRERRTHAHQQPPPPPSAGGRAPGVFPTAYQAPTGLFPTAPKPRYQTGGKYTTRSRQARRMDPGTYTQHDHGRAAEFASEGYTGARVPSPRTGTSYPPPRPPSSDGNPTGASTGSATAVPPPIRNPTWLQRQMDIAKEWEDAHCREEPEENKYEWRKASNSWLDLKERRRQRDQMREGAAEAA